MSLELVNQVTLRPIENRSFLLEVVDILLGRAGLDLLERCLERLVAGKVKAGLATQTLAILDVR